MDLLQLREKEIFETLKKIAKSKFVIIGGYAVNAYTLPRFSVDCDIVLMDKKELSIITRILKQINYREVQTKKYSNYAGEFYRFEKKIKPNFKVSMDILLQKIHDRQTNVVFDAEWIFENSKVLLLRGKTITEKLNARIINIDALTVMKFISLRNTDMRDVFMLIGQTTNSKWIRQEIEKLYDFSKSHEKLVDKITSKEFKDNLQGVFGYIDQKLFEKNKEKITEMKK